METFTSPVTNPSTRGTDEGMKRYVIARDGNGNEIRHLNFDNPEVCPREGIIRLEPLRKWDEGMARHKANLSFTITRDRKDNLIVGIPQEINPDTRKWEYQRIRVKGPQTFDLSIKSQAEMWACIKLSPFIEGSPNLQDKPLYKVVDSQKQAQSFMQGLLVKRKAEDISIGLKGDQLTDMARALGISPEQNTAITLQAAVIQAAQKDGEKFMRIWDSPTRKYLFIIKKAVLFGIVDIDVLNGYMYRGVPIGATEQLATQWLAENVGTANAIDVQCQDKETPETKYIQSLGSSNIGDEKDAQLAALKAENDRKDALIKQLSAKALKDDTGHTEGEFFVDEELQGLRDEMKALKIGGHNMIKDKEKARAKIAEAKKANN